MFHHEVIPELHSRTDAIKMLGKDSSHSFGMTIRVMLERS